MVQKYQEIYPFEHSESSKHRDKDMYFDPDEQFTQLANEFNIRYDPTFNPVSDNQDMLTSNNDEVQTELSFDAFPGVSVPLPQNKSHTYTNLKKKKKDKR